MNMHTHRTRALSRCTAISESPRRRSPIGNLSQLHIYALRSLVSIPARPRTPLVWRSDLRMRGGGLPWIERHSTGFAALV